MAQAQKTSRRQHELEAAAAIEEQHRGERDTLSRQIETLDGQIRAAQEELRTIEQHLQDHHAAEISSGKRNPAVGTLRERRRALKDDIEHWTELRSSAFTTLHGDVLTAHTTSYQSRMRAQVALQREPCEQALLRIDTLLRDLEAAWRTAWSEASTLAQNGDDWGRTELSRIRNGVTNVHAVGGDGPHVLILPHFPESA